MSLASAAHCSVFRFSTERIITRTVFDIAKLQAIDHDDEAWGKVTVRILDVRTSNETLKMCVLLYMYEWNLICNVNKF